jgi:hypothetical protein
MLRMTKTVLLAGLMLAAVSTQAAAQDQEAGDIRVDLPARKAPPREEGPLNTSRKTVGTPGPLRVYGGFGLAVGGGLTRTESVAGFNGTADLDPTVGLQFGADYVLHKYFSIGGETRFLWWKPDGAADRNFLWDLDVKPRGRYAFGNIPLEVYGALPIGLSVAGLSGEPEGGAGFNVGLVGGANWFFNSKMAINAEIGWQFHRFGATVRNIDAGNYKMNQFLLLCPNFVYVL